MGFFVSDVGSFLHFDRPAWDKSQSKKGFGRTRSCFRLTIFTSWDGEAATAGKELICWWKTWILEVER